MRTEIKNPDVWGILRKRYPASEYALMAEVRDAAGFYASRSADYIVMNLWPSRGLSLSGIELKSHRGDWLSERKKPAKAEAIFQFCDYFWLLTSDESVAVLDEIPETWGWMMIRGDKITVKKEAPKLTPTPIDRSFLAALLKRASDKTAWVHVESIQDKIAEAKERGQSDSKYQLERCKKELVELTKAVRDFELASGTDLSYRWGNSQAKDIGEAIKFLAGGGAGCVVKDLKHLEDTAKRIHEAILKEVTALNNLNVKGDN